MRMNQKQVDPFYRDPLWLKARHRAIARAGFKCQGCAIDVRGKGRAVVHHIAPRKQYPHLALEQSNLLCLCSNCHNKIHDRMNNKTFNINELQLSVQVGHDGFPIGGEWG